jgi:hypothetical protein
MSNLKLEIKDENTTLLSTKGERNTITADASSIRSAEQSKGRIAEIRNQINQEAAKIKSQLINAISQKPIPKNTAQKKEEIAQNSIKSTIVSVISVI